MARIVSNFFISLDGVVESPEKWHMPYFDDQMGAVVGAGFAQTRAMLLGHRLYGEWAAYWPNATDEFAETMNGMQKYVVAHEPLDATWSKTTVIVGDKEQVADQLRALKEEIARGDTACPAPPPRCAGCSPRASSTSWSCCSTRSSSAPETGSSVRARRSR